jgi:hypothetical protein
LTAPSAGVAVNAGDAPARTWPAAPVMEITPVVVLTATGEVALCRKSSATGCSETQLQVEDSP